MVEVGRSGNCLCAYRRILAVTLYREWQTPTPLTDASDGWTSNPCQGNLARFLLGINPSQIARSGPARAIHGLDHEPQAAKPIPLSTTGKENMLDDVRGNNA